MKIDNSKAKLLLHVCCACCATEVYTRLKDEYEVTLFWFNPNIYPFEEYQKRLDSFIKLADDLSAEKIIIDNYEVENIKWHKFIKGLENEPEGGRRCEQCYRFRLEQTAQVARENDFDIFTTTLTISPHKNAAAINEIGNDLAGIACHPEFISGSCEMTKQVQHDYKELIFLQSDFKKQDGFKKSIELSNKHALYRQNYCGCEYSLK